MADMDTATRERLTEAARACRILDMEGHGDMTLGHLSVRETGGRGFWMKRNQIGLGEVLGPDDFVLVDWDGQQIAGSGGRHSEWPIHSEIFRARTDVNVVVHTASVLRQRVFGGDRTAAALHARRRSIRRRAAARGRRGADHAEERRRGHRAFARAKLRHAARQSRRRRFAAAASSRRSASAYFWKRPARRTHRPRRKPEDQHAEPRGARQAAPADLDAGRTGSIPGAISAASSRRAPKPAAAAAIFG